MSKVVHFLVLIYYVCVDYHIFTYALPRVMDNVRPVYDNRYLLPTQMCTLWLQVAQQVYFLCCFIDDILDFRIEAKLTLTPFHQKLRDFSSYLFSVLVFPYSIIVSFNFWSVFLYEHTYIDGHEVLFEYISRSCNHILHTGVVILALLEIYTNYTKYPSSMLSGLQSVTWYAASYVATILILQPYTSIWVYPFIEIWSRSQLVVYVLANLGALYLVYIAGYGINYYLWSAEGVRLKKL